MPGKIHRTDPSPIATHNTLCGKKGKHSDNVDEVTCQSCLRMTKPKVTAQTMLGAVSIVEMNFRPEPEKEPELRVENADMQPIYEANAAIMLHNALCAAREKKLFISVRGCIRCDDINAPETSICVLCALVAFRQLPYDNRRDDIDEFVRDYLRVDDAWMTSFVQGFDELPDLGGHKKAHALGVRLYKTFWRPWHEHRS